MSTTQLHTIDDLMAMSGSERYELIEGELFEVSPSSLESSVVAGRIFKAISNFVDDHDLGYVTGADGGYVLSTEPDTVVAPDVAFLRKEHFPGGLPARGFSPIKPDFAVEVRSPTDEPRHIRAKRELYEGVEISLLWWVDPKKQIVTIDRPGRGPRTVGLDARLDGEDILPGFLLELRDIFRR